MGLWDKIKKTLLKSLWPAAKKRKKTPPKKARKRKAAKIAAVSKKSLGSKRPTRKSSKKLLKKSDKKSKRDLAKLESSHATIKKKIRSPKAKKISGKAPARQEKTSAGELIGTVTHYFPQVNVAALKIERRGLMTGETLYFQGHTTKFKTVIKSMQINRKPVLSASVGDEIGILVPRRVRAGDQVFFKSAV